MYLRFGRLLLATLLFLGAATLAWGEPASSEQPPRTDLYGDPLPTNALMRLGTVRLRHGNRVEALVFFPDSKRLATGSEDRKVRIWDSTTGKELYCLKIQQGTVRSLAVSADGKVLASGGGDSDGSIRLWDPDSGALLRRLDDLKVNNIVAVALSPDGKTLAASTDEATVYLWNYGTDKPRLLAQKLGATSLAFSADGKYLLSASYNGERQLWDVATGKAPDWFAKRTFKPTAAAFTDDGKTLVLGAGRAVRWWDLARGEQTLRAPWSESVLPRLSAQPAFPGPGGIPDLTETQREDLDSGYSFGTFSPDGRMLARLDRDLVLRESSTGKKIAALSEPFPIEHFVFSPDGKHVATGSREGVVRVWDLRKRELLAGRGHVGLVAGVVYLPDGKTVATASADHSLRLWDAATGKELQRLSGHEGEVQGLDLSPDGKVLASAGHDNTVRLWDTATGEELHNFAARDGARRVVFSPAAKMLIVEGDDTVHVRDLESGKDLIPPLKHPDSLHALAIRPDGKMIAAGIRTGPTYLWDPTTGKELRRLETTVGTAASLAFSPDGKLLAVGYGGQSIFIWDPETGKEVQRLTGHTGWVNALSFSPDGKSLASGSGDGKVFVWDLATSRITSRFEGHQSEVLSLGYSPDGKRLVSGSRDTTVLIWDLGR